jgi:hypothetical protein
MRGPGVIVIDSELHVLTADDLLRRRREPIPFPPPGVQTGGPGQPMPLCQDGTISTGGV